MLKYTKEEKDIIHRVHLISGKPYGEVTDVIESLCIVCVMAYMEKEPIDVPMLGRFEVKYNGDKIVNGEKEADITINITPGAFIKRVIGQIEDGDESDIEKILKEKIRKLLKEMLT